MPLYEEIRMQALALENELVALRRHFHRFPELGFEEVRTSARVAEVLRGLGLEVRTGVGGHGVLADLAGAHPGPTIAIRADMDALPIAERTGLPFASENPGVMHACGHDVHMTVLLGAAMLLSHYRDRLHGSVRFLFQSAEEFAAGAKAMIAEGVLDGVSEIYGQHNLPQMPAGQNGIRPGVLMGSIDKIEIRVEGKGGHGGYPETAIDPIVAAGAVLSGLQTIVSRETPATVGAVVTIGTIHAGTAYNIISDTVEMTGTVRSLDVAWRDTLKGRIERIVAHVCEGYRCVGKVNYIDMIPAVDNDAACAALAAEVSDGLFGATNRIATESKTYGDDFAEFLKLVPGCYFWLGSGPREGAELTPGLHSPLYNPYEECLANGAAMFAGIALKRLSGSAGAAREG